MKPLHAVLCFLICPMLSATAALAHPVFNDPADVKAITSIETRDAVDLDMARIASNYFPGAVVYDLMIPGVYKGHDQIVAGFGPQLKAMKTVTGTLPEVTVFTDGTLGCAATQMKLDLVMQSGSKMTMSLRQLDALRKVNGRWLVEEEHVSLPADPKTGLSLMNAGISVPADLNWGADPFPGPRLSTTVAKTGIRAWTQEFALAPSAGALLATMGPGDNELIFDLFSTTPLQGEKAITAAYAPAFAQIANTSVAFTDFASDSDGLMGMQIDQQKLAFKMKNGTMLNWTIRQSDCLHYDKGKWYSVFDELSFPVDMKSGKTVTE